MIPARAAAAVAAALCAAGAAAFEPAGGGGRAEAMESGGLGSFDRYEIILGKSPFGAPPRTGGPDDAAAEAAASSAAAAAAAAAAGEGPEPPARLASVSRFGGVPAAGFVESGTGKQFLLRVGEKCGSYTLVDLDPELGAAVLRSGTNEWLVSISWANGQATDIVPSARDPYLTAFRPEAGTRHQDAEASAPEPAEGAALAARPGDGPAELAAASGKRAGSGAAASTEITPEEEAGLVARATVSDPDGGTHVSFRELNRLRAQLRREKADAARAAELAAWEEKKAAADAARAAEEAAAAAEEEEKSARAKRERAALISAIAQGYDVGEDVELTDEEARELRQAGFQVPE